MTTAWVCLTCHATGTTTGTESGGDVKHQKATGHSTFTTTRGEWVERLVGAR